MKGRAAGKRATSIDVTQQRDEEAVATYSAPKVFNKNHKEGAAYVNGLLHSLTNVCAVIIMDEKAIE